MTCLRSRLRLRTPQSPRCHARPNPAARAQRRAASLTGRRSYACVAISPLGRMAMRSLH